MRYIGLDVHKDNITACVLTSTGKPKFEKDFHEMKMALLIVASCPVGSNVAVYAQLHQKDYAYAVENVIISTLLSVVTIPAIVWLAGQIW